MSGEWIKMRQALQSDPKVLAIGKFLDNEPSFSRWLTLDQYDDAVICDVALRYLVTGALHNVWCNANEHCNGDFLEGAGLTWVDSVTGIENFGAAMQSVGWVEVLDEGIRFPKFKRYRERKAC